MAKLIITLDVITDPANLDPTVVFDPIQIADAIERHVTTPLHDGYGFPYVIEHGVKDELGTQVGTVKIIS